jgi:hypothetical protein
LIATLAPEHGSPGHETLGIEVRNRSDMESSYGRVVELFVTTFPSGSRTRRSANEPGTTPAIETPVVQTSPGPTSVSKVTRFEASGAATMSFTREPAGAYRIVIVTTVGPEIEADDVGEGVGVGDENGVGAAVYVPEGMAVAVADAATVGAAVAFGEGSAVHVGIGCGVGMNVGVGAIARGVGVFVGVGHGV